MTDDDLDRRVRAALAAIVELYGTDEGEASATLFVTHHLEEVEADYWVEHFGTDSPEPDQILESLVLHAPWDAEEDDEDESYAMLDFTLPGEVTNYVLGVTFDEDGNVEDVVMES